MCDVCMWLCVCMCVCVHACVCACVCMCVCVHVVVCVWTPTQSLYMSIVVYSPFKEVAVVHLKTYTSNNI